MDNTRLKLVILLIWHLNSIPARHTNLPYGTDFYQTRHNGYHYSYHQSSLPDNFYHSIGQPLPWNTHYDNSRQYPWTGELSYQSPSSNHYYNHGYNYNYKFEQNIPTEYVYNHYSYGSSRPGHVVTYSTVYKPEVYYQENQPQFRPNNYQSNVNRNYDGVDHRILNMLLTNTANVHTGVRTEGQQPSYMTIPTTENYFINKIETPKQPSDAYNVGQIGYTNKCDKSLETGMCVAITSTTEPYTQNEVKTSTQPPHAEIDEHGGNTYTTKTNSVTTEPVEVENENNIPYQANLEAALLDLQSSEEDIIVNPKAELRPTLPPTAIRFGE